MTEATYHWMGATDFNQTLTELDLLNDFLNTNPTAVQIQSTTGVTGFYLNNELWVIAEYASWGEYGTQDLDDLRVFTKVNGMTYLNDTSKGTYLSNVTGTYVEFHLQNFYGLFITTSPVFDTNSITTPVAPNNNVYVMVKKNVWCKLNISR